MKYLYGLLAGLFVSALIVACTSGEEAAGDRAYDMARKTTGGVQRQQQKTAYIHYGKAIRDNPTNVSTRLRNRFLEMSIERAYMVLQEGGYGMDAIRLLMEEIEDQLKEDADPAHKQRFAAFIAQLGDSASARDRFLDALKYYDDAIEKAVDAAPFRAKRDDVVRRVADENYELGREAFATGKRQRDEMEMIRAEYFAKVALNFDSTHEGAKKLLSEAYAELIGVYTAFPMAVQDYTDTVLFRSINKWDILLAVPTIQTRGNTTTAVIHMYSNTFNPLRMRSEHFFFVNEAGQEFRALPGQRMQPDFLEREREGQYTLRFPAVRGRIRQLVYENGPHRTEKNFF